MDDKDVIRQNELAWNKRVKEGSRWTRPVSSEDIKKARMGKFQITLTASKAVPRHWFPPVMEGRKILCLAGGGGQQGPILAAAGAKVTVFDLSDEQLNQDRLTADREKLDLTAIKGDMRDLSVFPGSYFDIVFCPVSVTYVPEVRSVFRGCGRVLKPGGVFMLGASNPFIYLFDNDKWDNGIFEVGNKLPYNSFHELSENERRTFLEEGQAVEFSHTLEELIGGQIEAGMVIIGFYEDTDEDAICEYSPKYFATRALKL